jgi:hypothetical protein
VTQQRSREHHRARTVGEAGEAETVLLAIDRLRPPFAAGNTKRTENCTHG